MNCCLSFMLLLLTFGLFFINLLEKMHFSVIFSGKTVKTHCCPLGTCTAGDSSTRGTILTVLPTLEMRSGSWCSRPPCTVKPHGAPPWSRASSSIQPCPEPMAPACCRSMELRRGEELRVRGAAAPPHRHPAPAPERRGGAEELEESLHGAAPPARCIPPDTLSKYSPTTSLQSSRSFQSG